MALLRYLGWGIVLLFVAGFTTWGGLALWFTVPFGDWLRIALGLGLAFLGFGGFLLAALWGKWLSLLGYRGRGNPRLVGGDRAAQRP